jgi:succinate dehydrogenase flavin-adding protein (antitoxin of CptAB toxin-antitoxin module)
MNNKNLILQQLITKMLVKSVLDNFHNQLKREKISHAKLSRKAGKPENAFNKTFNECEDPSFSSFLKYWHAFNSIRESSDGKLNTQEKFHFEDLIKKEDQNMLNFISQIKDYDLNSINTKDKTFLKRLKYYFDILKLSKSLTDEEISIYEEICNFND